MKRANRVPAKPLAMKIDHHISQVLRRTFGDNDRDAMGRFTGFTLTDGMQLPSEELVARSLGVGDRQLRRWRDGAMPKESELDPVLTNSPWLWWEIWNEDTVRKPILSVRTYRGERNPPRRNPEGVGSREFTCPCSRLTTVLPAPFGGRYRQRVRVDEIGDAGPDLVELARIERLFTGTEE